MFESIFGLNAKRERLLNQVADSPVKDFLSVPFVDPKTKIHEVVIVSMDFETTGLNPNSDKILSVGHVTLHDARIDLSTSMHQILVAEDFIPEESAVIHRITDDIAAEGREHEHVVEELLDHLKGKVLLAHHAAIERGFLQAACQRLWGTTPIFPIIDTLQLARQWFDHRGIQFSPGELRLYALREQYHLPRYPAHNALSDAVATAELFLAMMEHIGNSHKLPLKRFLT